MQIVTAPDNILAQPAQPVVTVSAKGGSASGWDKKILKIINDMKKTLLGTENPKGVGLAAPQIGEPYRIFITKPWPKSEVETFINPEITWKSEEITNGVPERDNKLEGCLSVPGIWGVVKRHRAVKLKFQTLDGKWHEQKFTGFMAIIIQHEIDHLYGRLFSSRVIEQKGNFYQIKKDKEGKEVLEEMKLA